MSDKWDKAFMDTAWRFADLSSAVKLKVGAIVVKNDRIISIGYNGTPSGWDNVCEITQEDGSLLTKPEVIHAEMNAIAKLARSSESGQGSYMYITHSPCLQCAKGIYGAGITRVMYDENYRCDEGILFLKKCGIVVSRV